MSYNFTNAEKKLENIGRRQDSNLFRSDTSWALLLTNATNQLGIHTLGAMRTFESFSFPWRNLSFIFNEMKLI